DLIVATAPAHGAGSVDITVSNETGTSAASSADHFAFVDDRAPVANDDVYTGAYDKSFTVSAAGGLLANDTDGDNDALTITAINGDAANVGAAITLDSGATVTINSNGSFTVTPAQQPAAGIDYVCYTVSDGTLTATAWVTFNLTDQAPTANDGTATTN